MEINELKRRINIGNVPVKVFTYKYNELIDINIKITKKIDLQYKCNTRKK